MPKYQDPTTGFVQDVGDPTLNPELVKGQTLVPDTTKLGYGSAPINSSVLGTVPSLNLPVKQQEPNYVGTLASLTALTSPQVTPEETQQTDLQKRILDLTKSTGQKEQFQAEQDKTFGVTESSNQLNSITRQINALNLEAAAIPLQVEKDFTGRASVSQENAISRELVRNNTIKALGLSAQGQLIQGNIANAKSLADRAVAIKFAPMENELKYLQTAYTMNKDTLEREDKKRADALKIQLDERQRLLDTQKENFKIAQAYAFAATKNNPNNQAAALAAQEALNIDPSDPNYLSKVFGLVGGYQGDPNTARKALDEHLKSQQDILESQLKIAREPLEQQKLKAEIAKIKAQTAEADATANKTRMMGVSGFSPIENLFENAVVGIRSVAGQETARIRFNQLMKAGKTAEAERYVDTIAKQGLTGKQKNDYSLFGMAKKQGDKAIQTLNTIKSTNFGVYKTLLESTKPYTTVERDQNWVKATSEIGQAIAGYRNAIFGATLTGYELEAAKIFLVDFKTDDLASMETKLKGMIDYANDYRTNLIGDAAGNSGVGDTTLMTSPDGKPYNVPNDKVELFKQNGYK